MSKRPTSFLFKALILTVAFSSVPAMAQNMSGPAGEDDTILVEKEVSQKIPYHKILKRLGKQFLKFDTENVLTFGLGKRDSIIRNFSDFADRMKYRVDVDKDELELKFSLNF